MQTDSYPFYPDYETDRYEDLTDDQLLCKDDYDLIPQSEDDE